MIIPISLFQKYIHAQDNMILLFFLSLLVEEPKCSYNETIYTIDPDIPQCPSEIGRYIVPILRGVYVMFSNILLLNLLISVFW